MLVKNNESQVDGHGFPSLLVTLPDDHINYGTIYIYRI